MIPLKIALIVIVGVIAIGFLKNSGCSYITIIEISIVTLVIGIVFPIANELIDALKDFNFVSSLGSEAIKILLKVFVALSLGSFVSDVCRDNGETALGSVVDFSMKLVSLKVAIPVFMAVISLAAEFLNR